MSNRKHIKAFQSDQYKVADERIMMKILTAILTFKSKSIRYYQPTRQHKRYQLI